MLNAKAEGLSVVFVLGNLATDWAWGLLSTGSPEHRLIPRDRTVLRSRSVLRKRPRKDETSYPRSGILVRAGSTQRGRFRLQ